MAFTYLALNIVFCLFIIILFVKTVKVPSKTWWITLGAILLLTLIFDNLAIALGFFSYAPDRILGIHLWRAPIEDFFYAIMACLLVPVLWRRFASKKPTKEHAS